MASADLIDVVKAARDFSDKAGWGFFKLKSVNFDKEIDQWILSAYLGAFEEVVTAFQIDDTTLKVRKVGPES